MPLKDDCRRDVPAWLADIKLPNIDSLESYRFPLNEILKDSLYYPASGFDGRPIRFLAGFIHSFIYVDYGTQPSTLHYALENEPFRGYRIAGKKCLQQSDLAPDGWSQEIPPEYQKDKPQFHQMRRMGFVKPGFASWYIFERESEMGDDHGPQRFSLVYICGDGVATYQALYSQRCIAPKVLTIIRPGTGFGGNYTDFHDPDGLFARIVLHGIDRPIPEYLVHDAPGPCWPTHYEDEPVESWPGVDRIGVWRCRNRSARP